MLKKMGKKLINNLGLKILAVLFAIAIWLVVVSINDPVVRKSATISVTIRNQDYIVNQDKYSDILSENNTVTFYYSTTKSTYENLSTSDFSAVADMEKIEYNKEEGTWRVPVTITPTRYVSKITIESKQLYLDVALEDLSRAQFLIKTNTIGKVAEGCALGEVKISDTNANVVTVSGPASVVNQIDSVVATINLGGMAGDITDQVLPEYYDKDGNVIDTTKLTATVNTVSISAQILNTKYVTLEISTTGTVMDGYRVKEVAIEPKQVLVKGESYILNKLDKVTIPGEVLDLTDVSENIEKEVDISTYLQNGVSVVDSSDAKINVSVKIEPIETKVFRVSVDNLVLNGLKEGYVPKYEENYFDVTVSAGKSQLEALNAAEMTGTIEAEYLGVGTHEVNIIMDLDTEIYSVREITMTFSLESHDDGANGPYRTAPIHDEEV